MQPPNQPMPMNSGAPAGSALEQLNLPGILLLVVGAISGAFVLFNTFAGGWLAGLMAGYPGLPPELHDALRNAKSQGVNPFQIFCGMLEFAGDVVVVVGAIQMRNLKMFPLAMAAAIIAMIPCFSGLCCIFGIPIGIWALMTLNKPEVKSSFT